VTGIAAIQARVAAIESRFGTALAGESADTSAAPTASALSASALSASALSASALTATGGAATDDFAGVLSQALREGSTGLDGTGLAGTGGGCCCCATRSAPIGTGQPAGTGVALGPAVKRAPGDYGKLVPPAELAAYGNGRIPGAALQPIGEGDHRLWGPAATAFRQLRADAAAAGVDIGITDSYRDYDTQVSLARRKGLYSQGGLAATPGSSNHGWGMAVDLDLDDSAQVWMRENAWRYGFVEDTPREPWHWGYRPAARA
jgi:hypothetical protein